MTNKKQALLTGVTLAILAVVTLSGLDSYGKNRRVYHRPARAGDPGMALHVVATPGEAFSAWKDQGFTGRKALFIAGTWGRVGNIYEAPVSRPYPLTLFRLADALAPGDMTSANVLLAASLNGIVRAITVVLPGAELNKVEARARAAKEFRIEGDTLYFPYQGLPRLFTTSAGLKHEKEPVLLYVSASYFRTESPEDLYGRIRSAGVETDDVILCEDRDDAAVSDSERGELLRFAGMIGGKRSSADTR